MDTLEPELTEAERRKKKICQKHDSPKVQDKFGDLRCIQCEADKVAARRFVPLAVVTLVLILVAFVALFMASAAL